MVDCWDYTETWQSGRVGAAWMIINAPQKIWDRQENSWEFNPITGYFSCVTPQGFDREYPIETVIQIDGFASTRQRNLPELSDGARWIPMHGDAFAIAELNGTVLYVETELEAKRHEALAKEYFGRNKETG